MSEPTGEAPEERLAETEHWWAAKIWMVHSNLQIVGRRGTDDVAWLISRVRELTTENAIQKSLLLKRAEEHILKHAPPLEQIAELEADRRRLDWLEDNAIYVVIDKDTQPHVPYMIAGDRAAIDAAMNAESKEEK